MIRETAIPHWLSALGAPDVWIVEKGMGFIGAIFRDFCPSRNIVLYKVIHGRRQSLCGKERGNGHVRATIGHIVGNRKENCSTRKEWEESPEMAMMHLDSQVQKFVGVTPAKRVFGRALEMPIGTAGNPHFWISRIQMSRPRPKQIAAWW